MDNVALISSYFPDLTAEQIHQFTQLKPLYVDWNEQINVISRKDIDQLYERHVLHSLGLVKFHEFSPGSKILDVGTGGGFPGIPLAIMFPECQFLLVDSIGKKIKVVREVAEALNLNNVTAMHQRAEKVTGSFNFIVSRAVTRMKPFYQWVHNKVAITAKNQLRTNGILYLKGGDLTEEMEEFGRPYEEFDLNKVFVEEFFNTKKVIYVPVNAQ